MSAARPHYDISLHRGQKTVFSDKHRFRVIVAGRRWGKTQIAKVEMIIAAASKKNQIVWYVAPTYTSARDVMWETLKRSVPKAWLMPNGINETRMTIRLVNGSMIQLKGADKPDSLRGVGLDFLVMDESQDIKEHTWEMVLQPTLASTGGRVLIIGTPKSYNWLYDKYILGQRGEVVKERRKLVPNEWKSWQFPTITSPFVPRKEIARRRRDMDERSFRQEFEASFETMSGRVYYPFDRTKHIKDCAFNSSLPIYVGQDFNIDPMSSVIIQEQLNGEIWVVDELYLRGSNTQETADELQRRYWEMQNRVTIYPDPAGNSRTQARGESSLDILREAGFKNIKFKLKHPAVDDRINAVNRLLMTAEGTIRLFVDHKCRHFIESLEQTIYKEGSREVDKGPGNEHITDAFGYYADFRHPMRKMKILGVSL